MAEPKKSIRMCIRKGSSFTAPSIVKIRVGTAPNCVDFAAHESFLITRSEFFRRALNGNWEEAKSRIVKLPDEVPEIFGLYLDRVYTGHLHTARKSQDTLFALDKADFVHCMEDEYTDLINVYTLAEKLQDTVSKNATVIAIVDVAQLTWRDRGVLVPSLGMVNKGFDGTPKGSPLRRLLIDLVSNLHLRNILCQLHSHKWNSDLLKDLADRLDCRYRLTSRQQFQNLVATKAAIQDYME